MRLGCGALLLLLTVSATASVQKDIERQYARWAKAALSNDVETVLSVIAPDYTLKTYTGTVVTRKEYEASLRKRRAEKQKSDAYQSKIASLQVNGNTAIVISDETSTKASKDPITQRPISMVHVHRYQDTWVKIGAVWRLRSTVTQMETTRIERPKIRP